MKRQAALYLKSLFFGLERNSSTNMLSVALINDPNTLDLIFTSFDLIDTTGKI